MVVSVGGGGGGVGCIIGGFGGSVGSIGGSFCVSGGGSGWKLTGLMPVKAIASLGVWEEAWLLFLVRDYYCFFGIGVGGGGGGSSGGICEFTERLGQISSMGWVRG